MSAACNSRLLSVQPLEVCEPSTRCFTGRETLAALSFRHTRPNLQRIQNGRARRSAQDFFTAIVSCIAQTFDSRSLTH